MIKITGKTLMVNFETEVKLGNNDAIELTLINQAWISEGKDGGICVDLEIGIEAIKNETDRIAADTIKKLELNNGRVSQEQALKGIIETKKVPKK